MKRTRDARRVTPEEDAGPVDPFSLDRALIDATRHWQECDMRRCRRAQCCAIPEMPCRKKNEAALLWWKRRKYIPYLRARYPTVQWGAPAGTMEPQLEAALAAETQKAEQGNAKSRRTRPKQRRGRRRRQTTPAVPSP